MHPLRLKRFQNRQLVLHVWCDNGRWQVFLVGKTFYAIHAKTGKSATADKIRGLINQIEWA